MDNEPNKKKLGISTFLLPVGIAATLLTFQVNQFLGILFGVGSLYLVKIIFEETYKQVKQEEGED